MPAWHVDRGRKVSGGKIRPHRKKRKYERGGDPLHTRVSAEHKLQVRARGGEVKVKCTSVEYANVSDPRTGKTKRVKILKVLETPANPHFLRAKVITKGCIIETELGKARVTSRPSQQGVVNAVLIQ